MGFCRRSSTPLCRCLWLLALISASSAAPSIIRAETADSADAPPPQSDRPNVLMIAVDDLRPEIDAFGAEGAVTPRLDRLAQRGLRFTHAYCNIATCGASRASLMSGLRPTPDRFRNYLARLDEDAPDITSLPRTFREAGYKTISNGKVFHHRNDDLAAWSEPPWRPKTSSIWWAKPENRGPGRGPAVEAAERPDSIYPDYPIAQRTIDDLDRLAKQDGPFFLACGFYRPHLPFVVPQKYWELYPTDEIELPDNMYFPRDLHPAFGYTWGELRAYRGIPKRGPVSEETARQLIRGYRASVSFVDAQLGRVLDQLELLGLTENTIIVLWGDHGWQLGEHAMWCKHTNFEVAVRVPLLIVDPRRPARGTRRQLVEYIDLYPTLCDLAGLEKPDHLQGKSLLPLVDEPEAAHKEAVFSRHGGRDSVRTQRYRYSEVRANRGRGELRGAALFDYQKDPNENQCVLDDPAYANVAAEMKARLDALRESW